MVKVAACLPDTPHPAQPSRPHAHRRAHGPLAPALKQAVQQGHAFGEAHADEVQKPSLLKRLKRLG